MTARAVRRIWLLVFGLVLVACVHRANAQETAPTPAAEPAGAVAVPPSPAEASLEAIEDPAAVPAATVSASHPLFRSYDSAAKLLERPVLEPFETMMSLFLTLRVDELGKVAEAVAVEPPLKGLSGIASQLAPRWVFNPARKGGKAAKTWATVVLSLEIDVRKPVFTNLSLTPVGKEDPLAVVCREGTGEEWLARFPRDIAPPEPDAVSVEDVDVLPVPKDFSWKASSARWSSRLTALLEVSPTGAVARLIPTGCSREALIFGWLRRSLTRFRIAPAQVSGKPVSSWLTLDATLEYELDSAKERGRRMVKKNLRGAPPDA